ncbi:MAG: UvrD-helicase domain-containing protein [Chitinophagaceae bacterium]|nr:UvrD-helicase domain-containing protein [Chitinophagaceae bacterium]
MQQSYLDGLNDSQRQAVLHIKGPLMIVAGAGSGKTKVLTTRIAHLINGGVDAFRILALTFTNKAAAEMKERISHILGNSEARNLFIGTFHSVFAKILRIEAEKLGYPKNFTIYDTDDAKSVIKTILNELNIDDKSYKPAYVLSRISAAKNGLISPAEYKQDQYIQQEDARSNRPMMGDIYVRYANRCFKNGAMDFDDLLYKMHELLLKFPEVLSKYQNKFQYVLIDEYQDTNTAQYRVIKMLGAVHENICVVGDDAQSIYSFRGATVQNILQFKDDYNDVKVVKLEQNYRSTQSILNVANKVIGNNKNQIEKSLWTSNGEGEKIKIVRTMTDNDEGSFVADAISEMRLRHHYDNKDFAILYRTNAQSRSFEESLRRKNIPYKIYGGLSFYQRKEVKDLLAYLRLIVNEQDEENIKRVINYPVRGIGKSSLDRMLVAANEINVTLWEVMHNPTGVGLKGASANAVGDFVMMIKGFRTLLDKGNAYDLAYEVGKRTGLVKDLYNDKSVEGLARYENVQELLNSIKEFTETPNEDGELTDKSLGSYLQQITLLTDTGKDNDEDQDVVRLMTIHAAKGLEFPCVFSVGLEENLFPSTMSLYDREGLEEERRLFYVSVTRAKDRLWITYANSRYRFGSLVSNEASRFIAEVPPEFSEQNYTGTAGQQQQQKQAFPSRVNTKDKSLDNLPSLKQLAEKLQKNNAAPAHTPTADFVPDNAADMEVGMKIEHQKFGFGTINTIEGGSNNLIANIDFGAGHGEKKIMLNYAKLRIVR